MDYLVLGGSVIGEDVKSQWFGSFIDEVDRFIHRVNRKNRKNRTEDFLLHNFGVDIHVGEDGGSNVMILGIDISAKEDVLAFKKGGHARDVSLVDDTRIITTLLGIVSIEFLQRGYQLVQKFFFLIFCDKDIVRRNTSLTSIDGELGPSGHTSNMSDNKVFFCHRERPTNRAFWQ